MTVKAKKASLGTAGRRAGLALLCLVPAAVPMASSAKDGPYLTWRAKTTPVQQTETPPIQAPQIPVPPSPYGQVGDPYAHMLTWTNKPGTNKPGTTKPGAAPQPQEAVATTAPMRRAPIQQETATYPGPTPQAPIYQPQRPTAAYRLQAP